MRTQLLLRRIRLDRGRTALALVSLLLAAATLSAKLHVQRALIEPLQRSLSEQGPNLEINAGEGALLDRPAALAAVGQSVGPGGAASAELLVSARLGETTVGVRGVVPAALRACEPYLGLPPGALAGDRAVLGGRLAEQLRLKSGARVVLDFPGGNTMPLQISAVTQTGGDEEDQVLVELASVQFAAAAGDKVNRLEVVSTAMGAQLAGEAQQLRSAIPGARVRIGRESELPASTLLDQWHSLLNWAAGFVVLSAALAVLAAGLALRDRDLADMALLKALGASDAEILKAGAFEALSLGLVSGVLGAALGFSMARWMAHNLGSGEIHWDLRVGGGACLVAIGLSLASSFLPMLETLWVQPARLLQR